MVDPKPGKYNDKMEIADRPALIPPGWELGRGSTFDRMIGSFYYPPDGLMERCAFTTDQRHRNTRGVVHGGMISPAFDLAMGNASWATVGRHPCATVQLTVHYIGALQIGELAIIESEVLRSTRSLVFVRGTMRAGDRIVASANGVWKVMVPRDL